MTPEAVAIREQEAKSIQDSLTKGNSLCWHCHKAYGGHGCPWADRLEPNPNWQETEELEAGRITVRRCGDFDFEDDRPLDMSIIKRIMMMNGGKLLPDGFPRPETIARMNNSAAIRLLYRYNAVRINAGLPPLIVRTVYDFDEEIDREFDD